MAPSLSPSGRTTIIPGNNTLALLAPAILGESGEAEVAAADAGDETGEEKTFEFDPEDMDDEGRMLWYGELQVNMDPYTKQYVQVCDDITDEIKAGWQKKAAKEVCSFAWKVGGMLNGSRAQVQSGTNGERAIAI